MSFCFSVGDFITAADLIAQVVSALREASGSASQHQHITNKLGFLDRAIRDVNRLEPAKGLETTLEAIKTTALTCQLPLLEFLENIRRYNNTLGPGQSSGVMKDVFLKMKWQMSKMLEAAMKLEAEIVAYLGAINLLLSLYKVKVDALVEQRARNRFESLTTVLANLHIQTQTVSNNVAQVRYQVEQGTHIVRKDIKESSKETSQALKSLQQNCSASVSEFLKTARTLSEVTLQTYFKVSEIYNAVLWVQTRLSEPDTRHTWLQEPMRWEDAYGRLFPIPAEFDYLMMEGGLRGHFREGRGKKLVERNKWQLFDPSSPRNVFSAENWEPFPGMKITMAMIIPQSDNQMVCPRLNCSSKSYTDALGGGKICSECNTWFDSLPKSPLPQKITAIVQYSGEAEAAKLPAKTTGVAKSGLQVRDKDTRSDSEFEIDEEDLRLLKNARVRLEIPKQLYLKKREADVVITEGKKSTVESVWGMTKPRILPVEDDKVCARIGSKFLQAFECDVETARDGLEAVNKINNGANQFDLILMDIIMPHLDGVSATVCIREIRPTIPVIAMTSNIRADDIDMYFRYGMNDVLPKPFTKGGMLRTLEKHLPQFKKNAQFPPSSMPHAGFVTLGAIHPPLGLNVGQLSAAQSLKEESSPGK